MSSYVSRVAFINDFCQMEAYKYAAQSVAEKGYFRISAVLREANLRVSGSVVLWKRIVKLIEYNLKIRLVPVAQSFFLGQSRNRAVNLLGENAPDRHLATGRRQVAGYVSCGLPDAGSVVEEKAVRLDKIGVGFMRSAGDARTRQKQGQQALQLSLIEAAPTA